MICLVYVSSASRDFSVKDLVDLLALSRAKNSSEQITGMLLYKERSFIQALEGPEKAVRARYLAIAQDDRHYGVIRLLDIPVKERAFSGWEMGFCNLNDPAVHRTPGYSEFMNESFKSDAFRSDPGRAMRLLNVFRRNLNG